MDMCKINEEERERYEDPTKYDEIKFKEWLDEFDKILNPNENNSSAKKEEFPGPDTELTYWRERLNSLTLLSELTK